MELAGWIGVSQEATSRALSQLRLAGYIATGRRSITVVDLVGLSRFVGRVVGRGVGRRTVRGHPTTCSAGGLGADVHHPRAGRPP